MARRKILESTCDKCHATAQVELDRIGRVSFVLPPGWMHVQGNTNRRSVFGLDLCPDCVKPLMEIAGKYEGSSKA